MSERITFVHRPDTDIDPKSLDIQDSGLLGPEVEVAREDRFTVSFTDLPQEILAVSKGYQKINIRWASPASYQTINPFSSRLSPGLHVTTESSSSEKHDPKELCSILQVFGKVDCLSAENFTTTKDGKSKYFYQQADDLQSLIKTVAADYCPELDTNCLARVQSLQNAASLDFTFSNISQTLKITAFWPLLEQRLAVPASQHRRTEIGILSRGTSPNMAPEDIGVSGWLLVLDEKKDPSPSLFSFPTRHRATQAHFSSDFLTPTGLHPTLQLTISTNESPPGEGKCSPYVYLTLPKSIFADRYQLDDQLFMASKNLSSLQYSSSPVDLEAPAYTTMTWGSSLLVELAPPVSEEWQSWTAQIPLHLRYLEPSVTAERQADIPYPVVFWACEAGTEADLNINPFDRLHLGYDELFSRRTVFWHMSPKPELGSRLVNTVSVPVLLEQGASWIGIGTAATVALGFTWVLWKLLSVFTTSGYGTPIKDQTKKEK